MAGLRGVAVVCLALAVSNALDSRLDDAWTFYKNQHGKQYEAEEEEFRRIIWDENVQLIQQHNLEHDLGLHTYTLGVNEYADLSVEEYHTYLLGARRDLSTEKERSSRLLFTPDTGRKVPDTLDWREHGYVTPVKNQGQCGSCWAFSSTGAMEGAHFKVTGELISLSEQQLVDCCKSNLGCHGGWMDNSFDYVHQVGGIDTETYYPYQARETGRCSFNQDDIAATVSHWVDVPRGDEGALQQAAAAHGPIAVAIDAAHKSFGLYKSGVYVEPACSTKSTDHAVLVVGYGTEDDQDYWLVKNSWGKTWGDEGYIKMARNKSNQCAIASHASYPVQPAH